jgi:hypothetical protein
VTDTAQQALAEARAIAEAEAHRHSVAMGGRDIQVDLQIKRILLPGHDDDHGLIAATVVAECTSVPQLDSP